MYLRSNTFAINEHDLFLNELKSAVIYHNHDAFCEIIYDVFVTLNAPKISVETFKLI